MDLISLSFLLLILVASGVIGYVADRVGKKLGKKRLSFMGLRPKHTATLGTVLLGVGISVVTIGLVAAASSDARTWLREGSRLLLQRNELAKENLDLEKRNRELDAKFARLNDENSRLEGTNKQLKGSNDELKRSLEAERVKLNEAQQQRARLAMDTLRLLGQTKDLKAQVRTLQTTIQSNQESLRVSQTELSKSRASLQKLQADIRTSRENLRISRLNETDATHREQAALKTSIDTFKKLTVLQQQYVNLQTDVTRAEQRIEELTAEREKAEKQLSDAQASLRTAQERLQQASEDLAQINDLVTQQSLFLNESYRNARTEPLTFRKGEEVARIVVPGGADADLTANYLAGLIRSARVEALSRGAKGHDSGGIRYEVADIFDRIDPNTNTKIPAAALRRSVITAASGRVEDQILIATSSLNSFQGEVVSLEIAVVPNPVIYRQGDLLSEARIDGSLNDDRIYGQISDFVRTRLRQRAIQDRMIPKAGSDAPFGEVSTFDMLNLVRDVKRVGRNVRVQAFAASDIHAADPLRVEFRLK